MNPIAGLNWLDIIILGVVTLSCMFGLWRGLVREVLSLATWIAALIVARLYSEELAPLLGGVLEGETTRLVAAFALLFLATMLVGALVNHLMAKLLSIAGLRVTDRLLGGIFGVARGGLLVMLCIFLSGGIFSETPSWQGSLLIPYGNSMIERSRIFITDLSWADDAGVSSPDQGAVP